MTSPLDHSGSAMMDVTRNEVPCGGTHLVCTTGEGAEEMRHQLRRHIIPGKVKRFAFYHLRASQ